MSIPSNPYASMISLHCLANRLLLLGSAAMPGKLSLNVHPPMLGHTSTPTAWARSSMPPPAYWAQLTWTGPPLVAGGSHEHRSELSGVGLQTLGPQRS